MNSQWLIVGAIIAVVLVVIGIVVVPPLIRRQQKKNTFRKSSASMAEMSGKHAQFDRQANALQPGQSFTWPSIAEGDKFWNAWKRKPLTKGEKGFYSTTESDKGFTVTRDQ